jgi:predicted ATP-grasp superfamily ATP-dependent carboligase
MPTLIVLGASVRAAAMSALRAGWQPYAIDSYADRDLAAIGPAVRIQRYPGDFLPALAAAPPAPWLYTGGLENHPRLVDRLAAIRPLMGNIGSVLRVARDFSTLCAAAREAGCRFPRTMDGTEVFGDELPDGSQPRWLVKRRRASGGLHVATHGRHEQHRPSQRHYRQAFVEGQAASAVYVAAGGHARLLGVTRQRVGADFGLVQPFVYAGSVGPLPITAVETTKLTALGDVLASRSGLAGLFNIDFIRAADEIWAIEINPRYSASIEVLERALGIPFIELHLAACQSKELPEMAAVGTAKHAGKTIVYAPRDVIVDKALDQLITALNAGSAQPLVADLPRVGERIAGGSPVLTVLAEAETLAAVENQLAERTLAVRSVLLSEENAPQ